ncbi:MAG: hypothetical protein GEU79_12185 [Acidimicrobiia bacterium]|nr:hypothetical protein [Acidimicrobiia bacterium]
MLEGPQLEYKERLDPTERHDQLTLVKEIAAMANSEGGKILVGVTDDGTALGIPDSEVARWDPAKIGDLLDSFMNPDQVDIGVEVQSEGFPEGRSVVELTVSRHPTPPIVLCKDGNIHGSRSFFSKGTVLVRHNTKAEPAKRSDFLRWRNEIRDRILQQFQMVVRAPESAHLRMVEGEEVRDEPKYMLSRAVDLFRQRREKLLDGADLLYLFENRHVLDLSEDLVPELLIQSALRRRATLFFWIALVQPSPDRISQILLDALQMSDRDKSDMANAIPLIAAMYLTHQQYGDLTTEMAVSPYAHIKQAGVEYPTITSAGEEVENRRGMRIDGISMSDLGSDELLELADRLVSEGNSGRLSRRMPTLGIEYLARRIGSD